MIFLHSLARWPIVGCLGMYFSLAAVASAESPVTLCRDTWGVPHIFAETPAGGAYGLGYAQAEDRLDDIYLNLRVGLGLSAEVLGDDLVEQDYVMRLARNDELAKKHWAETCPADTKELLQAYVAGIQAYLADHPDRQSPYALELEPWKFLTIGRAMILRWPLGAIRDDYDNRMKNDPAGRSNEWAIAPKRTADGIPILHADPHLTWEGMAVLYEARVHAGPLQMCGFFLVGGPLMGYGHNARVGWANTTGGPDTADVYEMKMREGSLLPQYEYDGKWRPCQLKAFKIPVKGGKTVTRPALYSHLGPFISEPKDGVAYVAATPYFNAIGFSEQFYKMNLASNARELYRALGMNEYNEQNVMFADVDGTIAYVRNGRTPIRPDGYNFNAPVPGHTSKTAWKGIHSIDDLVQIFDPPKGYMQNCNISPETMMVDSPLTPDKYPRHIYNVFPWEDTPRGRRATQLLDADSKVTREDAIAFAMDVHDGVAPLWKKTLRAAVDAVGADPMKDADFAAAIAGIEAWNGEYAVDATCSCLYKRWREKCNGDALFAPLGKDEPLSKEAQEKLLDNLAAALAELKQLHGRWDVPWGDVYKIGRGDKFYPIAGADFGIRNEKYNYTETLFCIKSKTDPKNPRREIARNGSMAMILMFFTPNGVESYSAIAWGQSDRPDSPHFMDQGEKLFSKRKFKPTWWKREDLEKNLESKRELVVQPYHAPAPPTEASP